MCGLTPPLQSALRVSFCTVRKGSTVRSTTANGLPLRRRSISLNSLGATSPTGVGKGNKSKEILKGISGKLGGGVRAILGPSGSERPRCSMSSPTVFATRARHQRVSAWLDGQKLGFWVGGGGGTERRGYSQQPQFYVARATAVAHRCERSWSGCRHQIFPGRCWAKLRCCVRCKQLPCMRSSGAGQLDNRPDCW